MNCLSFLLRFVVFSALCYSTLCQQDTNIGRLNYSQPNTTQIVRQQLLTDAILPCNNTSGEELTQIEWRYKNVDGALIGLLNVSSGVANVSWTRNGNYNVTDTGSLLVRSIRRELVERYYCVASFVNGEHQLNVVFLRLDFSFWYAAEPFSLFYGSCLVALIFCATSFLLNIVWICARWVVLKWIKRTERLRRVRSMLVAMEKYRHRRVESLHECYNRRMSALRENYHNQVEAIRQSYADSADRFRDYRQARMDNMQQHLDCYYQQVTRIREFGHRQVELLWESYERSMSAVRTFTLEQRLKVLHQYKVKQRYVNKLLEALGTETNAEVISRKEAAIREVLGYEEPPPPVWQNCHEEGTTLNNCHIGEAGSAEELALRLQRFASYHSLPDLPTIDVEKSTIRVSLHQGAAVVDEQEALLALQPSTSAASSVLTYETRVINGMGQRALVE